ncbi:MAG: ABC transporter permease [Chitinophagaceae bacterium]|nr:ABC transporter permease [Chitinophagaceae bacterium]
MFKNYLKIAWRSLLKDRQFTALNVFGLSAGLACSLLIFLWVSDEMSFDRFFANDERLYRLMERRSVDGEVFYSHESSGRLSEAVKQALPEAEYTAAVAPAFWFPQNTLSVNDKNIKAQGQYAEKDYFNIFSFPLLEGDKNSMLATRSAIVLSDELATKLFGTTENIMGKPVRFDQDTTFYVSGVFKKMPANSSQQFDFVLSFDYFKSVKEWVTHWNGSGPRNFVLLKKGTDINTFNKKVENVITTNTGDTTRKVVAAKFSDGYLYNSGGDSARAGERIQYVNLFIALAVFVLVIACINFMNLSTAKAARRLKEVGIKKVVGAKRSQLIWQFLTESFLLTVLAMVIASGLAVVLLPEFNQLTGKSIVLHFTWQMAAAVAAIALITGFLAGSYPALYISGFNPLAILRGKLSTSTAELLSRKGLVVFQFALSTILIVAVTVIYRQVQYIRSINLGYNKENIVRLTAEGRIQQNQEAFLAEMQQVSGVVNAAYTFHNIVGRKYSDGLDWPGKDPNREQYFEVFGVSHNFIKTMDMQMKSGRDFSRDFGTDSLNIIINEAAAKVMGLKDPVGTIVKFHGINRQVIGVVSDFHFESMHEPIKPSFMHLQKGEGTIVARIQQENQQQTLAAIENLYKQYNPGFPFTFNFLDEAYQKQYETETRTATLSGYFAGLAIIISCLGLFGLAAFTAQKRKKEIGIRKVIGASSAGITAMLSKDFLKLIGIALLIAFPVSWWMMNSWLQNYTYRVNITAGIFLISGMLVLVITLIAISLQTIKAANANPVKALRSE